ncbi:MAG: hypothetical protein JKP98_14985 [Rhodobacteraceae bacterium]|nr:hypothetical protein [Paracoccaceae bacterium]
MAEPAASVNAVDLKVLNFVNFDLTRPGGRDGDRAVLGRDDAMGIRYFLIDADSYVGGSGSGNVVAGSYAVVGEGYADTWEDDPGTVLRGSQILAPDGTSLLTVNQLGSSLRVWNAVSLVFDGGPEACPMARPHIWSAMPTAINSC